MQCRRSIKQDKTKSADEQKNGSQENSVPLTGFPNEILLWRINRYLSGKDTACLAFVNRQFYTLFQPEIGKREAKDAAECAIYPGHDPSVRLLERVIDRYKENFDAFGQYDTPRNNALMRSVFGYCQRSAPINFMQAFAQGIYYIIENKEKLTRSFDYRNWHGRVMFPLDSYPNYRLGYEYFAWARPASCSVRSGTKRCKTFFQSKTTAALQSCVMQPPIQHTDEKRYCVMM